MQIDTRFLDSSESFFIDGLAATWTDTNGASNLKYSEYDPSVLAFHEAHVEAAETGGHKITVSDQPGCKVGSVTAGGVTYQPTGGSVTVPVNVENINSGDVTYFVDVACAG